MRVDPGFAAVVTALYGEAVDVREVWAVCKGMPDASAVHVKGDGRKKALAAGLVLGTSAEALATKHTVLPAVRAVRAVSAGGSRLTAANKAGQLALQAGNMGVGLAAAGTLLQQRARKPVAKAQKQHMRPKVLVSSAARLGRLQPVRKGLLSGARNAGQLSRHLGSVEHRSYLAGVQTDAMKARFAGRQGQPVPAHAAKPVRGRHRSASRVPAGTALALGGAASGAAAVGGGVLANQRRRPKEVAKAHELEFRGEVSKVDAEHRNVFGWCSLSLVDGAPVVDLQGDHVPIEEIEKSAYSYVLNSRVGGDMHRRLPFAKLDAGPVHTADLIESMVFTAEKLEKMGLPPDALPHGWWVGYHVNDDQQWADVKAGKRLGFSIHGTGVRKDMADV